MQNQFDLSAALRGMGVKGPEGFLEILGVMQPVAIVADLAAMGPAVIPPMSVMGGSRDGILGEAPVFQLRNLAKGGSWCSFTADTNSNPNSVHWSILEAPLVLTAPTALTNVRSGHQPSLVTGESGTSVLPIVGLTLLDPVFSGFNRGTPFNVPQVYIPSGFTLAFTTELDGSSAFLFVSTLWRDVPVPPGSDALTATLP